MFIKALTTPLISFEYVLEPGDYGLLEGDVRPRLRLSCEPGAEERVLAGFPTDLRAEACHSYGRYDLTITYDQPIAASEYLKMLMEFRRSAPAEVVYQTVTEFEGAACFPTSLAGEEKPSFGPREEAPLSEPVSLVQTLNPFLTESLLPENLRRVLGDFVARYLACEADQYISTEYRDMRGLMKYLIKQLKGAMDDAKAAEAGSRTDFFARVNVLEQLLELASAALYQRYASVEAHLEGVSFPLFAPFAGFNRVIAAASAIVSDVYNSALLAERNLIWEGFVCFAEAGFQHVQGDIYTIPVSDGLAPLRWEPLTHEVSHGAVDALSLDVLKEGRLQEFMDGIARDWERPWGVGAPVDLLGEFFAHWFDKVYFHPDVTTEEFVRYLWSSWIDVPIVWASKWRYLLRSLLMFSLADRARLKATADDRESRKAFIRECRVNMTELVRQETEQFSTYTSDVDDADWEFVQDRVWTLGLPFLLERCVPTFDRSLLDHVTREDDEAQSQAQRLASGEVITRELANPLRLLHHLRASTSSAQVAPAMALIISLANDFRQKQGHDFA